MKKRTVYYLIEWVAALILFHIICFATPIYTNRALENSNGFWTGYGFVVGAFVLHLVFSVFTLNNNTYDRTVKTSLLLISSIEFMIMFIIGSICVAIAAIPNWVGIILCYVVLFISVGFLTATKIVEENTIEANKKLNARTGTFRVLADKAQELIVLAENNEQKQIAQKVYDRIRYSDMTSNEKLEEDETEIAKKMEELINGFESKQDLAGIQIIADELLLLVDRRNRKCKTLKRQI